MRAHHFRSPQPDISREATSAQPATYRDSAPPHLQPHPSTRGGCGKHGKKNGPQPAGFGSMANRRKLAYGNRATSRRHPSACDRR